MRVLIVGAGATGGYFGGRLASAGRDVTFLVRARRAERLRAGGLHIVSPHGDVQLTPKLAAAGAIDAPFDAIVLAVKAYSLDGALRDIAPAVGPRTMILPLLNGMKHMDIIAAAYGADALLGSLCAIAATLDDEGRILHLSPQFHNFVYGETGGVRSERVEQLDGVMQGAGFNARLSSNILQDMWNKWMMLATLAGATCLMRGSIGEIVAAPGGRDFVLRFFDEVVAVATAEGYAPAAAFLNDTRALLTAEGSGLAASMFRDMQRNSQIEAGEIIGDLLTRANKAGVSTPLLATAYAHLAVYQGQLAGLTPRP
jgi:2-dehydropantoate 2-reductase